MSKAAYRRLRLLLKKKAEKKDKNHKVRTLNLFNQHNNYHPEILFLVPPEIHIKKTIEYNNLFGISSPYLLEKFRGYLSYKNIQAKLKNLTNIQTRFYT